MLDWPEGLVHSVNPYNEVDDPGFECATVVGDWRDEFVEFLRNHKIEHLNLNYAKGWTEHDYSFLSKLKYLKKLTVIDGDADNLDSIEELENLEDLHISYEPNDYIDFSELKRLKTCFLGFTEDIESIFDVTSLESFSLGRLKMQNDYNFEKLTRVKSLSISNSNIDSISFLECMPDLESLTLENCRKLKDFRSISSLNKLKYILIDGCKHLKSIDFLNHTTLLEHIVIADCTIDSIKPISKNKNVLHVMLPQINILDGDLSPLEDFTTLLTLFINDRRHYSHKFLKRNRDNLEVPESLVVKK
ncbi:MAG: hypothetical protein NE334_17480 [Lentisphaeraceae bacterium]|nr:hypothetical protein [Lentisphaeraceae bacterium]